MIEKLEIKKPKIMPSPHIEAREFIYEKIGSPTSGDYENYTSRKGITEVILEIQLKLNEIIDHIN